MSIINDKSFRMFVIKFILFFLLFYYGTILVISLAAPSGIYSSFVHDYFDYVSWLKISLMNGASVVANIFGYQTKFEENYLVRIVNARGVYIAYDCVGYGVMSFWAAFTLATENKALKKIAWLIFGLFFLWMINVLRIGLFLVSINKGWKMPLGIDHHTWFNIVAYLFIFIMIYFFNENTEEKNND